MKNNKNDKKFIKSIMKITSENNITHQLLCQKNDSSIA